MNPSCPDCGRKMPMNSAGQWFCPWWHSDVMNAIAFHGAERRIKEAEAKK